MLIACKSLGSLETCVEGGPLLCLKKIKNCTTV
jgi:hypothetical protein